MITSESLIELHLKSKSKDEIIESLARRAGELGRVRDVAGFLEAVNVREALFPTVIGYGIAVPYGKSSYVEKSFIAFGRSDEAFRWDSRVDLGARLIFLFGVPEEQEVDLEFQLLTKMIGGMANGLWRDKLLKAASAAEVVAVFEGMGF